MEDLETRLERVEAQLAIQQLAARYAVAVDARDLDGWTQLFLPDVDCGRHGRGRDALRQFIEPAVRTFYRSIHQICGHVIDLVNTHHAKGTVYCRAEHEAADKWVVMAICYFDAYERRDGRWFFARRSEKHWYSTDVLERPGQPQFQNWDVWRDRQPALPHQFPTWRGFWERSGNPALKDITSKP